MIPPVLSLLTIAYDTYSTISNVNDRYERDVQTRKVLDKLRQAYALIGDKRFHNARVMKQKIAEAETCLTSGRVEGLYDLLSDLTDMAQDLANCNGN